MRSVRPLLFVVIFTVLLSACGLSGPLYLPDGSKTIKPDAPDVIDQQINSSKEEQTP